MRSGDVIHPQLLCIGSGHETRNPRECNAVIQCCDNTSRGCRNLLWGGGGGAVLPEGRQCMRSCLNGEGGGGGFTRGAAMYAKLFERGGGGAGSPLTAIYQNWGGGGGGVWGW